MCALCVRELLWHTNSIRKPTPTINKFLKNETHRTARTFSHLFQFASVFFANNFFAFDFIVVVIAVTDVVVVAVTDVVVAALHVENYCTKTMRYSDSLTWL